MGLLYRFKAAIAMYGFVGLRWMSYEGGDFTWEDEYGVVDSKKWPLSDEVFSRYAVLLSRPYVMEFCFPPN